MNKKFKLISSLLSFVLILNIFPAVSFASSDPNLEFSMNVGESTVTDISGSGNNPSITVDADLIYDSFKNANEQDVRYIDFDTHGPDYLLVNFGDSSAVGYDSQTGTNTLSAEFWANISDISVNNASNGSVRIFSLRKVNSDVMWFQNVYTNADRFTVNLGDASGVYLGNAGTNTFDKWAHYVITQSINNGNITINVYVNGQLAFSKTSTTTASISGITRLFLGSPGDAQRTNLKMKIIIHKHTKQFLRQCIRFIKKTNQLTLLL